MEKQPLVSISCITYNHALYIRECLDGFLMQECDFDYEILIHDDASTDGTQDIIKEYVEKYPNIIKPIYQTENQYSKGVRGMMARFNFPRAKGKYIALCEGDDYWTDPLKLQKQVGFLEENEDFVLAFHNVKIVDEHGEDVFENKLPIQHRRDFSSKEMCGSITLPTLSLVFRNINNLYRYGIPQLLNGDKVLISYLSEHGKAKYISNLKGAAYRSHGTGVWSKIDELEKYKNNYKTFFELSKYPFRFRKMLRKNALLYLLPLEKKENKFFIKEISKFSSYEISLLKIKLKFIKWFQ